MIPHRIPSTSNIEARRQLGLNFRYSYLPTTLSPAIFPLRPLNGKPRTATHPARLRLAYVKAYPTLEVARKILWASQLGIDP